MKARDLEIALDGDRTRLIIQQASLIRTAAWCAIASAALTLNVPGAFAHPGGLNAEGCHNDRKRGGYHCHGARRAESSTPPRGARILGDAYYPNCAAARTAGVPPLRRGEPGYRAGLDRDNDGIACE